MGFKRIFGLGEDAAPKDPLADLGKKELLYIAQKLQSDNAALSFELTRQHERANQTVRVVSQLYTFAFGLVYQYIEAKAAWAESNPGKALPTMWLAARILDMLDDIFEKNDIKELQLGPDGLHIQAMYKIANRKLNLGSKVADYLDLKVEIENPPEEEAQDDTSISSKAEA